MEAPSKTYQKTLGKPIKVSTTNKMHKSNGKPKRLFFRAIVAGPGPQKKKQGVWEAAAPQG